MIINNYIDGKDQSFSKNKIPVYFRSNVNFFLITRVLEIFYPRSEDFFLLFNYAFVKATRFNGNKGNTN